MARLFNGTSDYLTGTLDLSSTAIVTVSFRLWWDVFANNDDWALSYTSNPDAGFNGFAVSPNHNSGAFSMAFSGPGGSTYWADFFTRPSAAAWHLYTFVFDRTNKVNKAWVDGSSQSLTVDTHNAAAGGNNFDSTSKELNVMRLGTNLLWGAGRMAELAIWDVELSSGDLATLHRGTLPDSVDNANLLGYWPMCGLASPEPAVVGSDLTVSGATATAHPVPSSVCSEKGYQRIVGPRQLAAAAETFYTVPTGARFSIRNVVANNPSGGEVEFTLSAGTDAAGTRLLDQKEVAAGELYVSRRATHHTLDAGEKLQGYFSPFASPTLLDSFTGSDETPITTNWTCPIYPTDDGLRRISNQLVPIVGGDLYSSGYYDLASFGPDCFAGITVVTRGADTFHLRVHARLLEEGTTNFDGYCVRLFFSAGTDTAFIERTDNNTQTILATIGQEFAAGDAVGISCIGSAISAWRKPVGGAWTLLGTATDATYASAGRLAIEVIGDAGVFDDFVGGDINPPVLVIDGLLEAV